MFFEICQHGETQRWLDVSQAAFAARVPEAFSLLTISSHGQLRVGGRRPKYTHRTFSSNSRLERKALERGATQWAVDCEHRPLQSHTRSDLPSALDGHHPAVCTWPTLRRSPYWFDASRGLAAAKLIWLHSRFERAPPARRRLKTLD